MHRNRLLKLISHYRKIYREEEKTIRQFTDFVKTHPNCFERSLAIGHITGSAWIVNREKTKILLTHHKKLNKWLQLGGHADGDSNILSVALRETFEESHLEEVIPLTREIFDLDIHFVPKHNSEEAHLHYDIRFALEATGSEHVKVSDESHALNWFSIGHLNEIQPDPSIQRMQKKWLSEYSMT